MTLWRLIFVAAAAYFGSWALYSMARGRKTEAGLHTAAVAGLFVMAAMT